MKRFYKMAHVAEIDGLFHLQLDGRGVKTPLKRPLALPTHDLAEALAEEWGAQADDIDRAAMPLTRMAGTAIDGFAGKRDATVDALARYGETDMVCYWAATPETLVRQQEALWRPLIDWVTATHAAPLQTATGVLPVQQSPAVLSALRQAVAALDDFRLVGLSVATGAAGSLVIGLALAGGRLSADSAFEAAQLDESFQITEWGEDQIATERRAALLAEFRQVERLLTALSPQRD